MKFSQLGHLALASAVSAALVLGITACGQSNTVAFVYVASANGSAGQVYGYKANGQSGTLSGVLGSPFPAGRNPIALVTSPNGTRLYALNHDDNTVIEYATGSDGKLYPQNTYNIPSGTNPNGMAMSPDGNTLYIVEAYGLAPDGTPFSATTPGIGALVQYPIQGGPEGTDSNSTYGSLGTPVSYPTCNNPVAVAVLGSTKTPGAAVYVVNDPSGQLTTLIDTVATQNRGATGNSTVIYPTAGACNGGAGAQGQITSYVIGSGNTLTPGVGSPFATGAAAPNAIASDPASSSLYVTDFSTSQMYSYRAQNDGSLATLTSPVPTGQLPSAITIDAAGKYIYVANYGAGTVGGFSIDQTGAPRPLAGASGTSAVGSGPASVIVENTTGRYVYTADFIASSVSSLFIDTNAGTTHVGQNSPFPGVVKATAVASVKHHRI
ncbi:MAG TPA: beta-propeller fold lactonase family protein [Acidobacteriaceae bacterium]